MREVPKLTCIVALHSGSVDPLRTLRLGPPLHDHRPFSFSNFGGRLGFEFCENSTDA